MFVRIMPPVLPLLVAEVPFLPKAGLYRRLTASRRRDIVVNK